MRSRWNPAISISDLLRAPISWRNEARAGAAALIAVQTGSHGADHGVVGCACGEIEPAEVAEVLVFAAHEA
jgi:hypothetical protein